MPMQFSCNDIRLTVLCVSAVLFLSFFNRLLTIKFSVLFSIMYSWFPFIHFLSIYFFTFLDFLDSSSRPSFPLLSNFISCLLHLLFLVPWIFYLFFICYPFFIWNVHLLKTPSLLTVVKRSHFSTSLHSSLSPFPCVCLSLSGAFQSFSLYDQLQAGRALLLCDRADREHAVGSRSC